MGMVKPWKKLPTEAVQSLHPLELSRPRWIRPWRIWVSSSWLLLRFHPSWNTLRSYHSLDQERQQIFFSDLSPGQPLHWVLHFWSYSSPLVKSHIPTSKHMWPPSPSHPPTKSKWLRHSCSATQCAEVPPCSPSAISRKPPAACQGWSTAMALSRRGKLSGFKSRCFKETCYLSLKFYW